LSDWEGKRGYVEVVDGFAAEGFAWLAVSRFEPPVIRVPDRPLSDDGASRAEMVQLVGELRISALGGEVSQLAQDAKCESSTRLAACEALIALQNNESVGVLETLLADAAQANATRQRAAELLGRLDHENAQRALLTQLRTVPQPVAVSIATALAGRKESAGKLLELVRLGHASPTLLREPAIADRLKAADPPNREKLVNELTSRLTPNDNRITKLIEQRRAGYLAGKFDPAAGQAVYARSVCVNCHRIGEAGKMIGPALDGIGNRGLDRLLEDLLDPNRNIDQAFKATVIETEAGQTFTVFGVREDGKQLVMFDSTGKMLQMPLAEITERNPTGLSPMPGNISEQIPEQDFYQLIAYLLSQKAK
jgi:putative heme-binding domain-containing protein